MTRIKSFLLLLLGVFAIMHSLYPPRIAESSIDNKRTRAYIFSDDFYVVDVKEKLLTDSDKSNGLTSFSTYNIAAFDTTRYLIILVVGIGLFLIFFGALSLADSKTSKNSK